MDVKINFNFMIDKESILKRTNELIKEGMDVEKALSIAIAEYTIQFMQEEAEKGKEEMKKAIDEVKAEAQKEIAEVREIKEKLNKVLEDEQ